MQTATTADIPRQLIEPLIGAASVSVWLTFVRGLVTSEAGMVAQVRDGALEVAALEPREADAAAGLFELCQRVMADAEPIVAGETGAMVAAWPISVNGQVRAVAAFSLSGDSNDRLDEELLRIEWAAGWLELLILREAGGVARADLQRHELVLQGFDVVLDSPSANAAALAVCNYLARSFNCERVVLGFVTGHDVAVECQSDSSHYVKKVNTMKLTRLAMQETADQLESVCWPDDDGELQVRRAHLELNDHLNNVALLSVPLVRDDAVYGVVLFERAPERLFDTGERVRAEALANLVGRVLLDKRRSEQPLHRLALGAARRGLETVVGPGHLRRKTALLVTVALVVLFAFWRGDYRPSGDALVEGAELRAMLAPFDGFLDDASARPGDRVATGDLLARLDARELSLERLKWKSQQAQARRQYEDALAAQDRAEVQIYRAQMDRAQAELDLLDYQLARTELRAPFDAVVVDGDLSQRIGSAVRLGETLFELAPEGKYRIVVFIDEFTISEIKIGQTGEVVLSALPSQALPLTVTRIMPLAEVRDGETVYRVEGELLVDDVRIRPGLVGVGKVVIEKRLVIVNWTRTLVRWMRLQMWRLWG